MEYRSNVPGVEVFLGALKVTVETQTLIDLDLPNGNRLSLKWLPHSQQLEVQAGMNVLGIFPQAANVIRLAAG